MIRDFKTWKIFEHFGNGEETFTEKLEYRGNTLRNLDFSCPKEWEEIENASGELTYLVELDVRSGGIEGMIFSLQKISLSIEYRYIEKLKKNSMKYGLSDDDDEEGELRTLDIVFEKEDFGKDPKIEVNTFPLYLNTLEVDLRGAIDDKGEIIKKKVTFEAEFGQS